MTKATGHHVKIIVSEIFRKPMERHRKSNRKAEKTKGNRGRKAWTSVGKYLENIEQLVSTYLESTDKLMEKHGGINGKALEKQCITVAER